MLNKLSSRHLLGPPTTANKNADSTAQFRILSRRLHRKGQDRHLPLVTYHWDFDFQHCPEFPGNSHNLNLKVSKPQQDYWRRGRIHIRATRGKEGYRQHLLRLQWENRLRLPAIWLLCFDWTDIKREVEIERHISDNFFPPVTHVSFAYLLLLFSQHPQPWFSCLLVQSFGYK